MASGSAVWKTHAKKVFEAVSCGSFDLLPSISAAFAREFADPYPASYFGVLKGWSDCMREKYDESARDYEKFKLMRDCLSQRKSLGNPAEETLAIWHLKGLINDFENKTMGYIRRFSVGSLVL